MHPLLVRLRRYPKQGGLGKLLKKGPERDISTLPAVFYGIRSEAVVRKMLEEEMPALHADWSIADISLVRRRDKEAIACSPDLLWR